MKILHTADWHLGKRLYDQSRIEEQRLVLKEIVEIAAREEVDAIVVAGDLYDSFNPPNEAIELFYKTLHQLAANGERAVIAIAGNHDSAERIEAVDPLARACGIILLGYPNSKVEAFSLNTGLAITQSTSGFIELTLPKQHHPLRILTTPYANEARLRAFLGTEDSEESLRQLLQTQWEALTNQFCDHKGVNLLVSHLLMMKEGGKKPEEPEDERHILHIGGAQAIFTSNIPKQIQYTALGHLHRHHFVSGHPNQVAYSGSILEYSFSETNQQKYVLIVEAEPQQEVVVKKVPITQGKRLVRKKFEEVDEAMNWLAANQDVYVELTVVSDDYLEAAIKKQFQQLHAGIMAIIPEVKNAASVVGGRQKVDLSQNRETLFKEYFQYKTGQEVSEEMLKLFQEIINAD
ncbi:MAG: metallophosphoesterase family protein [Flammeovirgaceae bacterium]